MRAVVTRVASAGVRFGDEIQREIGPGILVLVGVANDDGEADATALANKIATLRIFRDDRGAMNRSVVDVRGDILVVSQFTLLGDARGGRRPSFVTAAQPNVAREYYERVITELRTHGLRIETGEFGANMKVGSINDGPVTILLDTKKAF